MGSPEVNCPESLTPPRVRLVFPVALIDRIQLDEVDFTAFETKVLGILQSEGLNLSQRLVALYLLTQETARGKRDGGPVRGTDEIAAEASQSRDQGEVSKARLIRGLFLRVVDRGADGRAPQGGFGAMLEVLGDIAKVAFNIGSIALRRLNESISLSKAEGVSLESLRPEVDRNFQGVFTGLVKSGWLGTHSSIHTGICLMIVALSVGEWFVRAFATAAGRTVPNAEDLERARAVLATEFSAPSPALKEMISGGVFYTLFTSLMNRPSVAFSLANLGRK